VRKVVNFSAGPGVLPEEVLFQAQAEMLNWHETGMSIMELGHREAEFKQVAQQSEADLRELLSIPSHYHILFLAGGATAQFSMIPLNLLKENKHADYVETGVWSRKAISEAKRYGNINIAARTVTEKGLICIPPQEAWALNLDAEYVHYTPNETIDGVEFNWVPKTQGIPLIADMSSNILSKPINVTDYDMIYASAQKNIGQAGITVVIIRDELVKDPLPYTPGLFSYQAQVENHSLYNTPPTYSWYISGLVFSWMKRQGGVAVFAEHNQRKAKKLYDCIDSHADFYINQVHPDCRSQMNVPFNLKNQELTSMFLTEATQAGLANLRGHRLVGGIRASIYNAMPEEGVDLLVNFMRDFVRRHG